jgi:DNA-binding beta-propeller fold protein YncE
VTNLNRRRRTSLFYRISCVVIAITVGGTISACSGCKKETAITAPPVPIPFARAAYVTNNGSDTISILDRDSDLVVTRSVDIDTSAHEAPHHLAVDPRAKTMFVGLAFPPPPEDPKSPHSSHGNGSANGKLLELDLASLTPVTSVEVDENPGDVVLTHDGTKVLVTHFDMKRAMQAAAAGRPPSEFFATLQVWDAKTMKKIGSRAICVAPHGVVTTNDDKKAIVACYGSDEIAIVDLTSPSLPTSRFVLGASEGVLGAPKYGPYSAALSPSEKNLLVADLESQDARIFSMQTSTFGEPISLGARAMISAFIDETSAIVPLQSPDGLAKIDVATGDISARAAFTKDQCEAPHAVKIADDGRAFVVCEGDHVHAGAVVEIDPKTLSIKKRWTVGNYPDGIAFGR